MKRYFSSLIVLGITLMGSVAVYSTYSTTASVSSPKKEKKEKKKVEKIAWVEDQLASMSIEEKVGQFFMVAAYSNKSEEHHRKIDSMIINDKIGGIIFFQGQRSNLLTSIERFQSKAEVPLLIGMDAEWGVQMRLFGEERFPYNYTIGAANDPELTETIGRMMGQECRELGIHLNFAPVADVNSNPKNPVIGFRSYGEQPNKVASMVEATVKGMESQGVMTSIKHFPGHGDTDVDSHLELPIVNNSYAQINAIDFFPFRSGIRAGASTVMIGHLNVPALDPSGTPSSLSKPIIQKYLKEELGFEGLVVSDALGMKAVANRYGKVDAVVKAYEAGCDILLFPETVQGAIKAIVEKIENGELSKVELEARCRKLLTAKYHHVIKPKKYKEYTTGEIQFAKKDLYEKAITVIKNEGVLPIKSFEGKVAHVSIGSDAEAMTESMDEVGKVEHFYFFNGERAARKMKSKLKDFDVIITSIHTNSVSVRSGFGMPPGWRTWVNSVPQDKKNILVLCGNPLALSSGFKEENFKSIVIAYENNDFAMNRAGQFVMGASEAHGRLPLSVNEKFKQSFGVDVKWGGRLKESQPEALGIDPLKLAEIDTIVNNSIKNGVFPGCQIVVAVKGNVIYKKSFGFHTYDEKIAVKNTDIYDIASITKIAASTLSLMRLNSQGKFNLNTRLENYLPDLTANTSYSNIRLKDMMAHQAGLFPWIPFYVETLENRNLKPDIYQQAKSDTFGVHVANKLWIKTDYENVMYDQILKTPLKTRRYKYSDVGYYFVKKIVEKQTGKKLDAYVLEEFYRPMGLRYMRYNPLDYFNLDVIPPTENDTIFRKQLIHGYVHDQGASMMGGVGGHAGLFSNAGDLASLMQMFLNKGSYGGVQYINPEIVEEYTSYQFYPKNRRGAGFDKPTTNGKGGPTCNLVSKSSFGHSGFTGTLTWADPEHDVNFVFLSNRVYPDAENWKIVRLNVRTDIQRVIYESLR